MDGRAAALGHHDVEAVLERSDLVGRTDDVVFECAQSEGRAVVTENVPHTVALQPKRWSGARCTMDSS